MAQIGLNHRLSVAKTRTKQTRALYEGVLAASVKSPRADVDIFTFANVSGISIFYVEPDEALTPAHQMNTIWLEFGSRRRACGRRRLGESRHAPVRVLRRGTPVFSGAGRPGLPPREALRAPQSQRPASVRRPRGIPAHSKCSTSRDT